MLGRVVKNGSCDGDRGAVVIRRKMLAVSELPARAEVKLIPI